MKILIYTSTFYPNIGGMETMVAGLAQEFQQKGHEVKLVTPTPLGDNLAEIYSFPIYRNPGLPLLWKYATWCDVLLHNCISLKCLWMYGLFRKKIVVTHQTWYRRSAGGIGWQDWLKLRVCQLVNNISISRAIASTIPNTSFLIPNFYHSGLFNVNREIVREKEIVFLGRLVSDKGVDLLLHAVAQLKSVNLYPQVTIIGKGPEEENIRALIKQLGLQDQVTLSGPQGGVSLVKALNAHKIMVVPSRWEEPFGIVALEGIACGCIVVGSEGGGLKEAIGRCGITFPNGDVSQLTKILQDLLTNPATIKRYLHFAEGHLARHTQQKVAQEYLNVFQQIPNKQPMLSLINS